MASPKKKRFIDTTRAYGRVNGGGSSTGVVVRERRRIFLDNDDEPEVVPVVAVPVID